MGQIIEPCLVELGAHRPPFRQPQVARLALDRPVTLRTRCIAWQWCSVGVLAWLTALAAAAATQPVPLGSVHEFALMSPRHAGYALAMWAAADASRRTRRKRSHREMTQVVWMSISTAKARHSPATGSFRRHPWLVLLGIQPGLGPNTRRYGEFGMRVLAKYGLDRDARTQVLALLNNYVTGFAHRQVAWDQLHQRAGLTDEQWESQLQRFLDDARQDNPDLAADIGSRLHLTSANSFEIGLDCLIEGIASKFIEHRVDATTSPDQRERTGGAREGPSSAGGT